MSAPVTPPRLAAIDEAMASIDVMAVALRIVSGGPRGAIQASTVEVLALAQMALKLCVVTDQTFDMFVTADRALQETSPEARRAIRKSVNDRIAAIGAALEALGYGQQPQAKENSNGQG